MSQALGDIDRRLANILRYGVIASLDDASGKVTVALDDNTTTAQLKWFAGRAGGDYDWWAPEPGEQVMVFSPSGEISQGTVLPAIYSDDHPANGTSRTVRRSTFADGTVIEYDRAAHRLLVNTSPSSGDVVINCGGGHVSVNCSTATVTASDSVTLDTPQTTCTGNLTVTKALNVNGSGVSGATATITGGMNFVGGSVTHDGKNIGSTHTHSGVTSGGSNTGAPT